MEQYASFDLEQSIESWFKNLKVEPSFTEADAEELKSHLLDQIDDLKEKGLSEREAFLVASDRMNINEEIAAEYQQTNIHLIQIRKSIIILGGVLLFFLLYYFVKASSKLIFSIIFSLSDSNGYLAINWLERYLISWHFVLIVFFVTLFFLEKRTIKLIERIKLKPKHTIIFLLITGLFELVDLYIHPLIKQMLRDNPFLLDKFSHICKYFDITFPLLIGIAFIIIYYKYYRSTTQNFAR